MKDNRDSCAGCIYLENDACEILGTISAKTLKLCSTRGYRFIKIRRPVTTAQRDHRAILRQYGLEGGDE